MENNQFTPQQLHAHPFVDNPHNWDEIAASTYGKIMIKLVTGEKLSESDKIGITGDANTSLYGKGCLAILGWIFDFRPFMKRYIANYYGGWYECYAFNKTILRKTNHHWGEAVEAPNKHAIKK